MQKVIYPNNVYDLLELLPDECQNATKREESDACVYTNEDGEHCIAGEIIRMLGFDLPDVDDIDNIAPVEQLISNRYDPNFSKDAIAMLQVGQATADKLTHAGDHLAWSWAKRDMSLFYKRLIAEETAQRNLQAGY